MSTEMMKREKLKQKLSTVITSEDKSIIKYASLDKKTIYTSFDGDYMQYLTDMLMFVMEHGCIPINPEAALGYYVSTDTLGGKKVEVMKDCIKTELFCDDMWVFCDSSYKLSEGVLAEIMIWKELKKKDISLVEFFPDISLYGIPDHAVAPKYGLQDFLLRKERHKDISELNEVLLEPYKADNAQNAYIIANVRNLKHIDWARKYCYMKHITPVCPQTILPSFLYRRQDTNCSNGTDYMIDRLTLLSRSDNVFYFMDTLKYEEEIRRLDYYSCCELYYLLYHGKDFTVIDWADAGVPKYQRNGAQWALTSSESKEVGYASDNGCNPELREIAG